MDRFLAGRGGDGGGATPAPIGAHLHPTVSPPPVQPMNEINPGWIDAKSAAAPHAEAAPTARSSVGNGGSGDGATQPAAPTQATAPKPPAATGNGGAQTQSANGRKPVDFVSEDDVRRAIQKGEKIYVNAKTIITPSARDIGDPAEVFAKV